MKQKEKQQKKSVLDETLDRLFAAKRKAPRSMYWVLLVLYFTATVTVSVTAGSDVPLCVAGCEFPVYTIAGVFSSIANICVIFLAIYYEKRGFFTALSVLVLQLPMILFAVFAKHNLASLPGVFGNLLAITAIVVIYHTNNKIAESRKKMRDQAITDTLTGLPNWYASAEVVKELIRRKERFAAVSINLNGFKSINETFGFQIGNEVLTEIASRWKEVADSGRTGTLDFISRLSADEYAMIIRNYSSEEDVARTLRIYEEKLSEQMTISDCEFHLTASFGYSFYPEDSDGLDTLLTYADTAMHDVKNAKTGEHIRRFSKDMLKAERLLEVEHKIRKALEDDTIFCVLQPQYDMEHLLRGFEALARMKDENGEIISPGEFIPVAEKIGLIDKVDSAIYRKATEFVGGLIRETGAGITLSINVSVRHLMKRDFMDEIRELLQKSGIPAKQLEVEITESIMIESMDKAMNCIGELKELGVQIAIDDFGTGYSSLSYLHSFPADILKIDKSFIDGMNSGDKSRQYVAAIISLGHIMGFDVISEGVEEAEQIETLREIGCDYIQGFVWGRPLPQEEAEKLVRGQIGG